MVKRRRGLCRATDTLWHKPLDAKGNIIELEDRASLVPVLQEILEEVKKGALDAELEKLSQEIGPGKKKAASSPAEWSGGDDGG